MAGRAGAVPCRAKRRPPLPAAPAAKRPAGTPRLAGRRALRLAAEPLQRLTPLGRRGKRRWPASLAPGQSARRQAALPQSRPPARRRRGRPALLRANGWPKRRPRADCTGPARALASWRCACHRRLRQISWAQSATGQAYCQAFAARPKRSA